MSNQEREGSIKPPIFDGSNLDYWKIRTPAYLQSLGTDIWGIMEGGYTYPSTIPTNTVKCAKLQTLRIRYETLKMHKNESITNFFLRIDEVVNCIKNLGEEIKEVVLVDKFLRSLSAKFESKVSTIEEKEDLQNIATTQLHRILTTFEMRKGGLLEMRDATFKVSTKGK
eukprot:PITA_01969